MDEQKLNDMLARLGAPEPSKEGQNQALNSAMAAFDKKMQAKTQGKGEALRPTGITFINNVRRRFMQKRYVLSGAAGAVSLIAIMAVLGPSTFLNQMRHAQQGAALQELTSGNVADTRVMAPPAERKEAEVNEAVAKQTAEAGASAMPAPTTPMAEKAKSDLESKKVAAARMKAEVQVAPVQGQATTFNSIADNIVTSSAPMAAGGAMMAMPVSPPLVMDEIGQSYYKDVGRDKFSHEEENPVKAVSADPVSTFSIDVDTSSYSFMRKMINQGVLPQKDSVRPEEMINYFPYNYAVPETREEPFKPTVTVMDAPWKKGDKLVHIGIKGYDIVPAEKPRANLVFLIDTSGSMNSPDKLPLLKNSLKLLLDSLNPQDTVGIVTYAGSAGTALEPTPASNKQQIIAVIDSLGAGGSTAGAEGIRQAYKLAEANMVKDGVNRVLLATDGDFNVGITNQDELKSYIERERDSGVSLSVLGFGAGNYNDAMMQTLAQNGNGNAAYIDTLSEARKVLVQEASSTLFTIAKDVKIQVEFNPATVKEYRLIGYETRHLNREDFNNDKVDAGDIGSGHAVTAIYEITPVNGGTPVVDDLRYGAKDEKVAADKAEAKKGGEEYAFLKIRYKLPKEDTSHLITQPIAPSNEVAFNQASDDARFSVAVAGFAELLKGGKYAGSLTYDDVINIAEGARGRDEFGYRSEFVNLVRLVKSSAAMPAQQ